VLDGVDALPAKLSWRVLIGTTGSGKTRLLAEMARQGAQVLDLEDLAAHRGSVLGAMEGREQPGQKVFETGIWDTLRRYDPKRPVYVEAESKRIGKLRVPDALIGAIRAGECVEIEATLEERVAFLLRDYAPLVANPDRLLMQLGTLRELRGGERIAKWSQLIAARQFAELFEDLLLSHYDPLYAAGHMRYRNHPVARQFNADSLSDAGIATLAMKILDVG
jgi:tRNA 2-selenouridine synthase